MQSLKTENYVGGKIALQIADEEPKDNEQEDIEKGKDNATKIIKKKKENFQRRIK